jgi:hypothetical protein
MRFFRFISNDVNNYILLFVILYLSLIVGFIFDENSTGGAFIDYQGQKKVSLDFAENFKNTFFNYDTYATRHSPALIIFLSLFEKLKIYDNIIRIIYLHISLLLPIGFFLCLKIKFKLTNNYYFVFLTGLIFLSPTFRSLSIWPDSRILGLTIFVFSIYFYLKFNEDKKLLNCFINVFLCALASYVSPNFSVFSIFFFYKYCQVYNIFSYKVFLIIILNVIFALPAIYYIFILDINFLFKTAVIGLESTEKLFFLNYSNQILLISSIVFFYYFPFLITKIIKINFKNIIFTLLLSAILLLLFILFFDYQYKYTGGGIFFKISYYLFSNNSLFFLIAFISIFIILNLIKKKNDTVLLFFLLLLSNPQVSIYHKYYDPFLLILLFTVFDLDLDIKRLKNKNIMSFLYLYFSSFLLLSYFK